MAARVFVSPHRWPCIFTGEGVEKIKLSLALLPLPQSTLPAPYSSLAPSVFYSTSSFFFSAPSSCRSASPLLCRRFDIGNEVSALHGNNSGKDDINYLPIVWHMQGIVLAIIISTLSPEGINGATAALLLSAKLMGLFGEVVGGIGILLLLLLVRDTQCACPCSFGQGWITISPLNRNASSTFSICICEKAEGQQSDNSSECNQIHFTQSDYVLLWVTLFEWCYLTVGESVVNI